MIEVSEFTKAYGDFTAVKGLSFTVEPGEIVGLVGPNGAGKTTTLRTIAGIIRPTGGVVRVGGHDVDSESVKAKRLLALVPDVPALFPSLTVWEHLDFTAQVYGVENWEQRAEKLLTRFELLDRRDTLSDDLSRGMKQKVAVTSALLHSPRALLFDEPLTGLDPRAIRSLYDIMRDAAAEGAAVLLSTHLLGQIENLCSGFIILREGRLVAEGTRAEIRSKLPQLREDASLEEIFFTATEGPAAGAADAEPLPDSDPAPDPAPEADEAS